MYQHSIATEHSTHAGTHAGHHLSQQLNFSNSWNLSALMEIARDEGLLMHVERGKFFFRQGEIVDKLFLIKSGCVAFTRNCAEGHRQILEFFFDDSIFADFQERSYPASFSAQCLTDTYAFVLSKAGLRRIAAISDEIHRATNVLLTNLLGQAYDNLSNIGCRHGEKRAAFILCKLYDGFNAHSSNGSSQSTGLIPVRQIDIADAIGVTPVYINQILKSLKEERLININKGTIKIRNIKLLKEICGYNEI